jgi:hypothetical protein
MTYRAEFELAGPHKWLTLDLHTVNDSVKLRVNGQDAGRRLWQPYTFEIARFAKPGLNVLEIEVRNNMANLIHGNPRPMGLKLAPSLVGDG